MKEEVLSQIGFSKNEAKVYLALLSSGTATAGEIAKKSGVHRANVYDALCGLAKKGAAAYFLKGKTTYYEAVDPENLMNMLNEKEIALKEILPQLKLSHQFVHLKTDANIYEGTKPIKDILTSFLEKKEPIFVLGVPNQAPKLFEPFLIMYHKKRAAAKIKMKHIYNYGGQDRVKKLNSMPYSEAKYLPEGFAMPSSTHICGDEVIFIVWDEPILTIQIKNEAMAKAYKNYFDILWGIAQKD